MMIFNLFLNILPTPPTGTPSEIFKDLIDFFSEWIGKIGGIIAFIGAIKFAASTKDDDAKEQLTSLFTMVAGFMIAVAVNDLDVFNIPTVYSEANANSEFDAIADFIGKWGRRIGAAILLLGSVGFGFSVKDNNAGSKVVALRSIVVGAMIGGISLSLSLFI